MKLKGKLLAVVSITAIAIAFSITGASLASAEEGDTTYTKPTLQSYGTFIYDQNGDGVIDKSAGDINIAADDIKKVNDSVEALNAKTQNVVDNLDQIKYNYTKDTNNKGTLRLTPASTHTDN